jgi:hypothetical protein
MQGREVRERTHLTLERERERERAMGFLQEKLKKPT